MLINSTSYADTLFKPEGSCSRTYIYRSRTYPVDSSRKLDGEGLRKVLKSNPTAESYLNEYQANLKTSRTPAYIGTLGVITLIGGPIFAASKESEVGAKDVQRISIPLGISLLVSSYFFGKYLIYKNQTKLETAVQSYNTSAIPSDKIDISLAPTENMDGGEIKTIVPFQF